MGARGGGQLRLGKLYYLNIDWWTRAPLDFGTLINM